MRCAYLGVLATILAGCAARQDYTVVGRDGAGGALPDRSIVLEGHVTEAHFGRHDRPSVWQYLTFWDPLPIAGKPGPATLNATVAVERVLRGEFRMPAVVLRELRLPTEAERQLLGPYAIVIGKRLRLGFDRASGRTLRNLRLVPLGNTPELDAALGASRGRTEPAGKAATAAPAP